MKPKPLDLEVKKLINKFGYDESLNLSPLAENIGLAFNDNIEKLIEEIKQQIKQACEFYLKYQSKPFILLNYGYHLLTEKQLIELKNIINKIENSPPDIAFEQLYPEYNEWLFKLAFKGVLDEKDN